MRQVTCHLHLLMLYMLIGTKLSSDFASSVVATRKNPLLQKFPRSNYVQIIQSLFYAHHANRGLLQRVPHHMPPSPQLVHDCVECVEFLGWRVPLKMHPSFHHVLVELCVLGRGHSRQRLLEQRDVQAGQNDGEFAPI
jgi:hypothetical protein